MYNQGINTIYQPYGHYLPQISLEEEEKDYGLEMHSLDGRGDSDSFGSDPEWNDYLNKTYRTSDEEKEAGQNLPQETTMAVPGHSEEATSMAEPVSDRKPFQRQVSEESSFRNRGNWRSFISRAFNFPDETRLVPDDPDKSTQLRGSNKANWKSFINRAFNSVGENSIGTIEEDVENDSTGRGNIQPQDRIQSGSDEPVHTREARSVQERGIDVVDAESDIPMNHSENSSWVSVHLQDDQPTTSEDNDFRNRPRNVLQQTERAVSNFYVKEKKVLHFYFLVLAFITYNVYLGFAIDYNWDKCKDWCDGSKILVIITAIIYIAILYYILIKPYIGEPARIYVLVPLHERTRLYRDSRHFPLFMYFIVFFILLAFVVIDSSHQPERLISYSGLWVLLLLGYLFSKNRHKVNFRPVAWGVVLQFIFALIILRWNVGQSVFRCLGNRISLFLSFTDEGSIFVFNYLASGILQGGSVEIVNASINSTSVGTITGNINLPKQIGVFAFKVLPVIFFFSLFASILYYWGILQTIVMKLGWLLQSTLGTTAAESLNAAANIFLGQSEAPLLIRPFLPNMTKSELHAVMTGGFATIAGTVFAAYTSLGISPSHLLSASVMSAPAALAFSKLFYPETEISSNVTINLQVSGIKATEHNVLEAAANGVINAITLVVRIIGNLVAFIAFIYFIDQVVIFLGSLIGWHITMTFLLSKLCMPLTFMMGVPWKDCDEVGELIGIKTILNEFVAFSQLSDMQGTISPRAEAIATYALCGFSNFGSIGIQLGCLGGMAPNRIRDLAEISLRAMIAGSAACFMTACIAGTLMPM